MKKIKTWLKNLNQRLIKGPKDKDQLIFFLRRAVQRAILNTEALTMIEGVMHVSDMEASEIMVPRSQMITLKKGMDLSEILAVIVKSNHARLPIIGENKDEILGILHAKDLLTYYTEAAASHTESTFCLKDIMRPAVFIPESKRLDLLLNEFKANRNHMAIVVNEYGNVTGLVTIEDVLEQIVGEIEDEHDVDEALTIQKHTKSNYSVQALTPIAEFNDYFKSELDDAEFDTIGGIILKAFGHLPNRGEMVTIDNIEFTVLKANDRRIRLLGVRLKKKSDLEGSTF